MKVQGQNLDDIPFQAILGVWGSYFGLAFAILCVIAQFYIAVFPIGAAPNANDFFINMLALPIILALFIGWKLWKKTEFVRLSEIDLLTGRREMDLAAAKAEERAEKAAWPAWKKYSPGLKWANIKGLLLVVLSMTLDRKVFVILFSTIQFSFQFIISGRYAHTRETM
jgi:amino acid permease